MICNFVPTADCRAESVGNSGKSTFAVWISSHAWTAQNIQVRGVYACRCMCLSLSVLSVYVCLSFCLPACLPACLSSVCQYLPALHAILPPPSTQASSTTIRDMWVQEIRRLLQDQFTLIKGTPVKISSLSFPSPFTSPLSLAASLAFPFSSSLPPCLRRKGNCIWCSEQSYLPWQN